MCHSEFVPLDVQGAMEYTQDLDVVLLRDQIRYPIVTIEQNSNVALRGFIPIADLGKLP
jgi:hypothetical protein